MGKLVEVVFHWDDAYGECYDCGKPAAFTSSEHSSDPENKRCAVCAANDAAGGATIQRIEELHEEETLRASDEAIRDLLTETVRRASLAIGVYKAMLDETDTFEGEIGSDLAYFMGEVLKGDKFQAWLGSNDEFVRMLRRLFDQDNAVWSYVDLMNDDVDDVFPARIKTAILVGDVANLDEEDYPQAGAWVDVLKNKGE